MQCLEVTRRPAAFAFQGPVLPDNMLSRQREIVYLIDDDNSVREGLSELLTALGKEVVTFGTGAEYLKWRRADAAACRDFGHDAARYVRSGPAKPSFA